MSDNEITIIEGPTPVFEPARDPWAYGLAETAQPHSIVITQLRALNGPALVERCYRAWNRGEHIQLHYRNELGLDTYAPIIAAQNERVEEGDLLTLWLDLDPDKFELELDSFDSDEEDFDDDDTDF